METGGQPHSEAIEWRPSPGTIPNDRYKKSTHFRLARQANTSTGKTSPIGLSCPPFVMRRGEPHRLSVRVRRATPNEKSPHLKAQSVQPSSRTTGVAPALGILGSGGAAPLRSLETPRTENCAGALHAEAVRCILRVSRGIKMEIRAPGYTGMKQRTQESREKGVASRPAPGFALGTARCTANRNQADRWAR
jgi:hypothetical protein